jgi:DNA-3-methyladenine glycosylase II
MASSTHNQGRLDEATYQLGITDLTSRDKHLDRIIYNWGSPPFWTHPPGFPGLVLDILSQQVSLESARAAYARLENAVKTVTAANFLLLSDQQLLGIGFSRQKAAYVRGIAREVIAGRLDLTELETMEDDLVRQRLLALKGVGPWTADSYLLFALCRPDAWPSGDLALEKAVQDMNGFVDKPTTEAVDAMAQAWKPWRAVAARILWHSYLCQRGRNASL